MSETRLKILDTAERLFSEQGYAPVSLRHITAAAGVNLAAIHYHFGSKEELLYELVMRKAAPVNEERLATLQRLREAAGANPLALEDLLEAFLLPAIHTAENSPAFAKLMGRLYGEGLMQEVARKHFGPAAERFLAEMRRTLPDLAEDELSWRLHFMLGAMAYTLAISPLGLLGRTGPESPSRVARRIVAFLSGGFRAPVAAREKVEVSE